jgi:hypothetical protein
LNSVGVCDGGSAEFLDNQQRPYFIPSSSLTVLRDP